MPTGYTSSLYDGEQSFEDFTLRCARAMGALISMRDAPWDAPIPDEVEPSTKYHDDAIAAARARLRKLDGITPATAEKEAKREYEKRFAVRDDTEAERRERRARYEEMVRQVEAWEPPTADHTGLKDFMLEQLRQSIDFDTKPWAMPVDDPLSGQEWIEVQRAQAERNLTHHIAEREKEIERATARTAWIKALKASLNSGVAV
jgi:hypothetical protein